MTRPRPPKVQGPVPQYHPLLPSLSFAGEHLVLRYRANAKPQTLRIEVDGPSVPDAPEADRATQALAVDR